MGLRKKNGLHIKDATATPTDVTEGEVFYNNEGRQVGTHSCGIPLDDCTNISAKSLSDGIEIKWTDPEDVIFNGQVTARWTGTKLVRKEGNYPQNDKDGVLVLDSKTRNQHSTVAFKDTVEKTEVTYYYCLFPYTEKTVTMSDNNRFTGKRLSFDPVLKNNSWDKIAAASEQGLASQLWQIGDEIDLTLSGKFNVTLTLQIWDFDHFDKSDGTGKAGICFGTKHLTKNSQPINPLGGNVGGWNDCNMRKEIMNNAFNSMPAELKASIKEVKTEANSGGSDGEVKTCNDKVFLPGNNEVGDDKGGQGNQKKFPIFTDDNSRIKKLNNGYGNVQIWWTRSPEPYTLDFFSVSNYGRFGSTNAGVNGGVCFCFNI